MKVGDIVRVKSGGPKMTVNVIYDFRSPPVECVWMVRGEQKIGAFQQSSLVLVKA